MDSEERNPALPGAQILRLDEASGEWQVDYELTERDPWQVKLRRYFAFSTLQAVRFATDESGQPLVEPVDLLLAGVWSRYPGLEAYTRLRGSAHWARAPVPGQESAASHSEIRAFAVHRDGATGMEIAFAGASDAIFVGAYSQEKQNIIWKPKPEWQGPNFGVPAALGRVMSFAECNGKLFATIYNAIYERVDGPSPAWRKVFAAPMTGENRHISGFRGLTAIPNPSGPGEVLLAALEDLRPRIYRIDPARANSSGQYDATLELEVSPFLTRAFGTKTTFAIVAYNKITKYPGRGPCVRMLMGIEAKTPNASQTFGQQRYDPRAHFLMRDCDGAYSLHQIFDQKVSPEPVLGGDTLDRCDSVRRGPCRHPLRRRVRCQSQSRPQHRVVIQRRTGAGGSLIAASSSRHSIGTRSNHGCACSSWPASFRSVSSSP